MSHGHGAPLPPSSDGTVVLDIGGDIGALVLYTSEAELGAELDLTPLDGRPRVHTEVRERRVGSSTLYAAVYPQLPAGSYELNRNGQRLVVVGGRITESELVTASA